MMTGTRGLLHGAGPEHRGRPVRSGGYMLAAVATGLYNCNA